MHECAAHLDWAIIVSHSHDVAVHSVIDPRCLSQELMRAQNLCLHPHLDLEAWSSWKNDMCALIECIQKAIHNLEACASNTRDRMRNQMQGSITAMRANTSGNKSIEFRDPVAAVQTRYTDLEKALQAYMPYHPLSLGVFEPANVSERFYWLQHLQLSCPIALLKAVVGGSLGILTWVVKRDADMVGIGDLEEIEAARTLIEPLIPQVRVLLQSLTRTHPSFDSEAHLRTDCPCVTCVRSYRFIHVLSRKCSRLRLETL